MHYRPARATSIKALAGVAMDLGVIFLLSELARLQHGSAPAHRLATNVGYSAAAKRMLERWKALAKPARVSGRWRARTPDPRTYC